MAGPIFYVAVCLLGFALAQRRLATTPIAGPMVFVALGLLAGSSALGIITADSGDVVTVVNVLFQATLILVLFTDAAALHFPSWRKDAALPGRLLGIGLPLTIAAGGSWRPSCSRISVFGRQRSSGRSSPRPTRRSARP